MKLLAALFALSSPVIADVPPEQAERFTHIGGFNLADLPSFDALAHVFGPSPVAQSGDASEYDARVCYKSQDGSKVVEFFHGEVHWGFTIRTPTKAKVKCPASTALTATATDIAGVTLGMKKAEYVASLGHPTKATAQRLEHHFQYVHVLPNQERWDVIITLEGTFRNDRLDSFTVIRVETN